MALPPEQTLRSRASTSVLVLAVWIITLLCVPMHAGASTEDNHEHGDCVDLCCAHPGTVADTPSMPPNTGLHVPVPVLRHDRSVHLPAAQVPPADPETRSRGGPPDLQVFLT